MRLVLWGAHWLRDDPAHTVARATLSPGGLNASILRSDRIPLGSSTSLRAAWPAPLVHPRIAAQVVAVQRLSNPCQLLEDARVPRPPRQPGIGASSWCGSVLTACVRGVR